MWRLYVLVLLAVNLQATLRRSAEERRCSDWALTEDEINKARGQVSRTETGVGRLQERNTAELLIDGANYSSVLYEELERTEKGDFIYSTSFSPSMDFIMKPNASDIKASEFTTVYNTLARAIKRGVEVKMLNNMNVLLGINTLVFCAQLNLLCGHMCCGPEARHNNIIAGHLHTKMWIVGHKDGAVVFNGGIDLTNGRWDTPKHDDSPERQMNNEFMSSTAMHDHMLRLTGPIVVDYVRTFHQYWNDPYPAVFPLIWLPMYEWREPAYTRAEGFGIQAQLLRTVSCKGGQKGYHRNWAARGEFTAAAGFAKMVGLARSYLYLVDQCMCYPEALRLVREALPRLQAVIILTDDQAAPPLFSDVRYYLQKEALSELLAEPSQRHKVHIFSLVRDTDPTQILYVHSKLYMADDEYMVTGSFGIEQSAHTNDFEMGVGLCDPAKNFVKEQRRRLWAEHLMLAEDDPRLEDPMVGLQEWIRQADAKTGRVRHYFPKDVPKSTLTDLYASVYQSDGRCDD